MRLERSGRTTSFSCSQLSAERCLRDTAYPCHPSLSACFSLQRLFTLHNSPFYFLCIFLAFLRSYHLRISLRVTRKGGWRKHQYPLLFFSPGLPPFLVRLLASPALRCASCPTACCLFSLSLSAVPFIAPTLSHPSNGSLAALAIGGALGKPHYSLLYAFRSSMRGLPVLTKTHVTSSPAL